MPVPKDDQVLSKLQALNEKELTKRIVLPLMEAYDFDYVDYRHGPIERGADIVCVRKDELEELDVLAIQVKRLAFSGAVTQTGHLAGLFNQLRQCVNEPFKLKDGSTRQVKRLAFSGAVTQTGHLAGLFNQLRQCVNEPFKLKDGSTRLANRIWLVSPYPLGVSALEGAFAEYVSAAAHRIQIMDGPKLVAPLYKKRPEILADLGDPTGLYLGRIESELLMMQEASVFRFGSKVSLLPVYVDLDLSLFPSRLRCLLQGKAVGGRADRISIPEQEAAGWRETDQRIKALLGVNVIRPKQKTAMRPHTAAGSSIRRVAIELRRQEFVQAVKQIWRMSLSAWKNLADCQVQLPVRA